MSDDLLHYYNRELAYLRRQGAEFAKAYPRVAGNLRISEEAVEDPHVSRLLEGVAFLTSQIRQRLDDHFPEMTDILLGTLYPDYQAPIPSMTILNLKPASRMSVAQQLGGDLSFETEVPNTPACRFLPSGNHWLAPISTTEGVFENAPFEAPRPAGLGSASSVIRLRLSSPRSLSTINCPSLRFHCHGQPHQAHELYDLILRSGLGFAVVPVDDRRDVRFFGAEHIQPYGFEPDEAVVPYSRRSFDGYRLLVEHFLFPEKFLFAELTGLTDHWPDSKEVDLYLYLGETSREQEKTFVPDHLRLWCLPVVNLFAETLEPIRRTDGEHEYRLAGSYSRGAAQEVVRVESVSLLKNGVTRELIPYYGFGHPRWQEDLGLYWHTRRRQGLWAGGRREAGTETWLSLVDRRQHGQPLSAIPKGETLVVKGLCCHRNVPGQLPFGGGQPRILVKRGTNIDSATALTPATDTVRPELGDASRWQLLRHLTLDHFGGDDACDRLKAVLDLHNFRQTPESRALIDGIESVHTRPSVARVGEGVQRGFCQGCDITIEFSRPRYAGASVYLFSAVLDRFFAQLAQINSFTRLRIRLAGQQQDYHVWPARCGERELV